MELAGYGAHSLAMGLAGHGARWLWGSLAMELTGYGARLSRSSLAMKLTR